MIAMTIGLVVVAGMTSAVISQKQSYVVAEVESEMLRNAQLAQYLLSSDIRHAGFWGETNARIPEIPQGSTITVNNDCGGQASVLDPATPFYSAAVSADDVKDCLVDPFTDDAAAASVFVIKKTIPQPVSGPADTQSDALYVVADNESAELLRGASIGAAHAGQQIRQYQPYLYYVCSAGDAQPALCRTSLHRSSFEKQVVVDGVETIHVLFGVDSDFDGQINGFVSSSNVDEWRQVLAARLYLIVRSKTPRAGHIDDKTYVLGDLVVEPKNDHYRRIVTTNTFNMKNLK
jgi:type IV pilus assembly protein PilW